MAGEAVAINFKAIEAVEPAQELSRPKCTTEGAFTLDLEFTQYDLIFGS